MSKNARRGSSGSKGQVKNKSALLGVEAPGWEGAKREHPGSIRPMSNAVRMRRGFYHRLLTLLNGVFDE